MLCFVLPGSLCRAPSNRVKGSPFRPVRAVAVDLFPQTMHCELLLYFERIEHSSEKPSEASVDSAEIPATKPEAGASMEEDNTNLINQNAAEKSSS